MKLLKIFILILSIHSWPVLSKVKVHDLSFKDKGNKGELKIKFHGEMKRDPLVVLKKNILQIRSNVAYMLHCSSFEYKIKTRTLLPNCLQRQKQHGSS